MAEEREQVDIAGLTPARRNAHLHPRAQIKAYAESLRRFGQLKPIVLDAEGRIVAGHGLVLAARQLGWTTVWAKRSSLSGLDAEAFGLADNAIPLLAEWDEDIKQSMLKDLAQTHDMGDFGFDAEESRIRDIQKAERAEQIEAELRSDDSAEPEKRVKRLTILVTCNADDREALERGLAELAARVGAVQWYVR